MATQIWVKIDPGDGFVAWWHQTTPDSKVLGANMVGQHVGPMNIAIRDYLNQY